jgi:hypothetical protein
MKRIITITLFLLVLLFIGLILLNSLENRKFNPKENQLTNVTNENLKLVKNFNINSLNSLEGFQTQTSRAITKKRLDGNQGDNNDEGIIHSFNIDTVRDKFYIIPNVSRDTEKPCDNLTLCTDDSSCDSNQECADIDHTGSKCYNVLDKKAYELESDKGGYIQVKNETPDVNFSFSFGFILKNADIEKTIVSSETGLWSLKNKNKALYLVISGDTESDTDTIKINNNPISCYKYYDIELNVTDKLIKVNFDEQPNTIEIFLKPPSCDIDSDCHNGRCTGRSGSKTCKINSDTYYIGKSNDNYCNLFVGDIKVNETTVEKNSGCGFYGKNFKNRRLCYESCENSNCDNATCDRECSVAPKCEFETVGRHSIDCLKECIKNNDCDSNHCKEKCEDCKPNCPWNKTQVEDTFSFDSQYFDPDGKPSPLKLILNTISTDGTKVSVTWREPYEGKIYINGYISYLYKTFNKSEGVKINKITTKSCKGTDAQKKCEYILHDLIPNETYTLGIKSYNAIGLSKMSNLITFKASVVNINMDLRIEEEVDDYDVGSYNYCNVDN